MFTGLVQRKGLLIKRTISGKSGSLVISPEPACFEEIEIGESIAVNGACLTVEKETDGFLHFHTLAETLRRTNLGEIASGAPVNLERALRLGDRLGGHLVQGHVDATSHILDRKINDDDVEFLIALPQELDGLLISKGSIAVDGISLTISALFSDAFRVNIIPHTLSATTLESAQKGYRVNLEADMLGKYIAAQLHKSHRADSSRLSMDDLLQAGF